MIWAAIDGSCYRRLALFHISKRPLFRLVFDQNVIFANPPSEWTVTAKVLPAAPLVALGVENSSAEPLPLEFGERDQDGQDELGDAVTGDIATEVKHPQRDPLALKIADDIERV